jgi:ATP-binding cassette subfamily F protein uup
MAFEPKTGTAGEITVIEGDYTTYKRIRLEEIKRAKREAAPPVKKAKPTKTKKKGLSYNEQREFEGIEPIIESLEKKIAELEATLAQPETWSSKTEDALTLQTLLEKTQAELAQKMGRWEDLMVRFEESAGD